jgi:hypothetical protein
MAPRADAVQGIALCREVPCVDGSESRAAWKCVEIASFQLIELHSIPARQDCGQDIE